MNNEKEISFGAFDSELMHQEIFIPEGFTATIDGNKIILTRIENEDEKVRKAIIELVKQSSEVLDKQNQSNMLAWLEKQGEQKLPIEKLPEEMKTIGESLGFTTQEECDEYNQIVSDCIMSDTDKSEQKPADKEETKFKVGDEIKTANEEPLTITKIDEKGYWSEDLFICGFGDAAKWELVGKSISKIDPKFHEGDWVVVSTIKGDRVVQIASVEYLKDGYPSYITTEGRWFGNGTKARLLTDKDVEIATIPESKIVVSKSKYWSEEDEDTLAAIIAIIRKQYNGTNIEEKKYYNVLINWLKSLKDRVYPKQEWKQENTDDLTDFEKKELKKIEFSDVGHEYYSELLKNDKSDNIADYAYQCAYCMSHDWLKETATWDDVEKACKLGAEWNKRHHKSAWSDEDKKMIGRIRSIVEKYAFSQSAVDVNGDLCEKEYIDADNWLKPLKERYFWKPSKEQMHAFEQVYDWYNTHFAPSLSLNSLYYDLKKLKGE